MREFPSWRRPKDKNLPKWFILYNQLLDELDQFYYDLNEYKQKNGIGRCCKLEFEGKKKIEDKYVPEMFKLLDKYKEDHPDEFEQL